MNAKQMRLHMEWNALALRQAELYPDYAKNESSIKALIERASRLTKDTEEMMHAWRYWDDIR